MANNVEECRGGSPRWAYIACSMLVAAAFLMFGLSLDRYPPFYLDEPAFNASAARYVNGQSFVYVLHTEAPYASEIWAYHGPFFFRTQVPVFKLLGVSHFACRIPGYLAAHLAVLLLCVFLLRVGLWRTALCVAVLWIGDKSLTQVTLGRPDGVSLLFLVFAFVALIRALEKGSYSLMAVVACCVGMAAGFNPGAAIFGSGVCMLLLWRHYGGRLLTTLGALTAGSLFPALLVFCCWLPHPMKALRQFLWHLTASTRDEFVPPFAVRLRNLVSMAWWGRYWVWSLVLVVGVLVAVMLLRRFAFRKATREDGAGDETITIVAIVFAVCGIAVYLNSSMNSYYFVFFTIWPGVAIFAALERARLSVPARRLLGMTCAVLWIAWLPSLAWNVMRFREMCVDYQSLDRTGMVERLAEHIPNTGIVTGDPVYFVVAQKAGLNYTPLPFYCSDPGIAVESNRWCIVGVRYRNLLDLRDPEWAADRKLVYSGVYFRDAYFKSMQYFIYGPSDVLRHNRDM